MFDKKGMHFKENFHVKNQFKSLGVQEGRNKPAAKKLKAFDVFIIFSDLMKSNGTQTVKVKVNME